MFFRGYYQHDHRPVDRIHPRDGGSLGLEPRDLKKTTDPPGPDPVEGDPDHGRGVGEGLARPGGDRGGLDPRRRDLLERTAWVRVGPL